MPDITMNDLHNSLKEIRELAEKKTDKGALDALEKTVMEKVNAMHDEHQKKSDELVKQKAMAESLKESIETRMQELEAMLSEPRVTHTEQKQIEIENEVKAFTKWACRGQGSLEDAEKKYLRTDSNTEGGFLIPDSLSSELIKNITEISNIRALARVRSIGSKRESLPKRTALMTVYTVGEGEPSTESNSTYGRERVTAHRLSGQTIITNEDLQDSAFNMETLIREDYSESNAQKEGSLFVNGGGDAANEAYGFMNDADIAQHASGNASTLTSFDPLFSMAGELKTGYNPVWGMNRRTMAHLRVLKNGNGDYLWQNGDVRTGVPNAIAGDPVVEIPDMDNIGVNTFPIVYADMRRGYMIVDRLGITMIRDNTSLAGSNKVKFHFHRRVGGDVVLPEAFIKLKIATAI